jgi:hypothetical protein
MLALAFAPTAHAQRASDLLLEYCRRATRLDTKPDPDAFPACGEAVMAACRAQLFAYDGSKATAVAAFQCAMRASPPL